MSLIVLAIVAGVAAGVLAGLFGIGGGILFVPVLLALGINQHEAILYRHEVDIGRPQAIYLVDAVSE